MSFYLTQYARELRKRQTSMEVKMWSLLRNRRFIGYKFYRQYPLGPYIVDFCCRRKKIVIELDGGGHNMELQKQKDAYRDKYLICLGYRILRVWNNELDKNDDGVMERLAELLNDKSTTSHSP